MNRKERRAAEKIARKSGNKDLQEKLSLYSSLGTECFVCESPFDKHDMKMLSEWMIVVRQKSECLRVYCPSCWNEGKNSILSELKSAHPDNKN